MTARTVLWGLAAVAAALLVVVLVLGVLSTALDRPPPAPPPEVLAWRLDRADAWALCQDPGAPPDMRRDAALRWQRLDALVRAWEAQHRAP